jgi:hypothetical protein
VVPGQGAKPTSVLWKGCVWAMDNGAFKDFDAERFIEMLHRFRGTHGCLWVAVPDVVGNAAKTRARFERWAPVVRAFGFSLAFVTQDGQDVASLPWAQIAAIFIGGTDEWKFSQPSRDLMAVAHGLGKWVHMGRVNGRDRYRQAKSLGVHSMDGTGFTKFTDEMFGRRERWDAEPMLELR